MTLAIEFVAKPRLEARKDRIVAADREARALRVTLAELGHQLFELRLAARTGPLSDRETAQQLASLAQTAHRQAVSAKTAFPGKISAAGLITLHNVRHYCELVASQPSTEQLATAAEKARSYLDAADRLRSKALQLYSMPRWKFSKRKAAIEWAGEAQEVPPLRNLNG